MKLTEEILRAASALELKTRRSVPALLSGDLRSPFRGSGMQFKEFRHYEPGDDIRHMSWPVTARTGRATLKVFEEERELNVMVLVDTSGSSAFQYQGKRKIDMYLEAVALIGLASIEAGNKFGMLSFHNAPGDYLPPSRHRDQVKLVLAHLGAEPLEGKQSDLKPAFRYLQKVLKQRALVIILSDFLLPDFGAELAQMTKRNELILFHGVDDAERGDKMRGVFEVCDPETGEFLLLDANSAEMRGWMLEKQTKARNELENLAKRNRADYLTLSVQDDYLQRIVHFFGNRGASRL